MIPKGTRIRFTRRLECGPSEDHPAILFAAKGELGRIVGHGTQGYWVHSDSSPERFGASEEEFTPLEAGS